MPDEATVIAYVWHLADRLRLRPLWELQVRVVEHPGDSEWADAHVEPTELRYKAKVEICEDAVEEGGGRLRMVVVHELMHLYHRDMTDVPRLTLPAALSQPTYDVFWKAFYNATELMVDRFTALVAPTMPTFEEFSATKSEGDA